MHPKLIPIFVAVFLVITGDLRAAINVTVGNFASSTGGTWSGRTWTPSASGSKVAVSDLLTQLQGGTVTIATSNPGSTVVEDGDISITAPIDINSLPAGATRTLVLQAQDDVSITGAITDSNPATLQSLNFSINASLTTGDGDVTLGASLALGAGSLTLIGDDMSKIAAAGIATSGGDVDMALTGAVNFATGSITTAGGNFRISGDVSAIFNSSVTTGGGNFQLDITEGGGISMGGVTIDARGSTGTGSVSINGYSGGVTLAAGAQIKSGSRGVIAVFAGSATADLIMNAALDAGTGGVSLRAHNGIEINGAITSVGPVIIRADVDGNGAGSVLVNAPVTSTGGRIDISGNTVTTTSLGILDTSAAGAAGTIAISAQDGLSIGGNVIAGGILQLNPDSDGDGLGQQTVTASLISIGGNITIQGTGTLTQPIDSNGGNINIPATGSLTLNGPINSDGGAINILGAGPGTITLGPLGVLDARGGTGAGSIQLTNTNGAIVTQAGSTIFSGPLGSVSIYSQGDPGDVELVSPIVAGTGGASIKADGNLLVGATITSAGPVLLQANADGIGGGNLTIDAVVTTTAGPVTLKGVDLFVNQKITSPDKIVIAPTGVATVTGLMDGNVEIQSGTVRLAAGSIRSDRDITLKAPGVMEMVDSTVAITCRTFTQEAGTELIMKLGGTTSGHYNKLTAQTFTMGGKLTLVPDAGFSLTAGQSFDLFDFTTVNGSYASLNLPALPATMVWDTTALKTTGIVKIIYQPITSNGTPLVVTLPGDGVLNQPIDSNGGTITIPATGTDLLIKGNINSDGGQINVTQTGPGDITVGAGTILDASGGNGTGSINLTNNNGNVVTEPGSVLKSGSAGGINIRADGVPGDIISGGDVIAGTQGVSMIADGNVTITGTITSDGPVLLQADADGSGSGNLIIDGAINSKGNVTLKGVNIEINEPIHVEFPNKLILETTGTAIINAPITGNVEIKKGLVLAGNGTIGNSGAVSLLAPGRLGFINPGDSISPISFSMVDGSELIINIAGPNLYNRVACTGPMVLAGKLTVNLVNSYIPEAGAIYDILDYTSVSGDFTVYNLPTLSAGIMWDKRQVTTDGTLRVINIPPADSKTIVLTQNSTAAVPLTAGGLNTTAFTIISNPSLGSLSGTMPNLLYTPNNGFTGDDTFTYRVSALPSSAAATVTLKVIPQLTSDNGSTFFGIISGVDLAHSGSFYFSIDAQGNVNGRLLYGDKSYSFAGQFDANGQLIVSIPRTGGLPALQLVLTRTTLGGNTFVTGRVIDGTTVIPFQPGEDDLVINIAGPASGQYNRLNYNGPAVFSGRLRINLLGGYAPVAGAIFDILDFTTATGDFSHIDLPPLTPGLIWDTRFLKTDGTLRVIGIPPADSKVIALNKNTSANVTLTAGGLVTTDFTVLTYPAFGTISGSVPNLLYTPQTDFVGDDSFSYRVGSLPGSAPATITLKILPALNPVNGGTYFGIINGPDLYHSGSFYFTVNGSGQVTGRIVYGDQSYAFTGTFDANGQLIVNIPRGGGLPPLQVILTRSVIGGTTYITGRVVDGTYVVPFETGNEELTINIAGPDSGEYNRLNFNGPAALSGKLRINLIGGYMPAAGAIFDILDFTSVSGDFSSILLPQLDMGLTWDTRYLKTDGTLRVISIPPADSKTYTTIKNVALPITLTAGGLSHIGFSIVSAPTQGMLSGTMPNLIYTPVSDFVGSDSFTYQVAEAGGNATVATVNIQVLSGLAPVTANTYSGLIVGPDFAHSGSFTLTLTGNSFTGRIIYGDQSLPISGVFNVNGEYSGTINRAAGLPPITLILNKSVSGGVTLITGRIIDGGIVSVFEGGGGTPPGDPGLGGIATAGRFTMSVFPNSNESGISFPQGYGHTMFTISYTGRTTMLGRLPDGTYFTNAGRIQRDGTWPIHIRLYSGKGAFQALARFVDNNTVRAATTKWWKPALQSWTQESVPEQYPKVLYPGGFLATPALDGARYQRPIGQARIMQAENGASIRMTFIGGNLPSDFVSQVLISNTQTFSYNRYPARGQRVIFASNNPYVVNAYFNTTISNLIGQFRHPVSGKLLPLRGVIKQRTGQAYGSFSGITETGHWIMEVVSP